MSELQQTIVNNLSNLIRLKMIALSSEQKYPGTDPDEMDDKIKLLQDQIKFLLTTRANFETIMTDVILTK